MDKEIRWKNFQGVPCGYKKPPALLLMAEQKRTHEMLFMPCSRFSPFLLTFATSFQLMFIFLHFLFYLY
jgi:hypothetical protein